MKTMLRKWEYIAKRCDEEDKHEAAEIARQIDDVLVELYPNTLSTPCWEEEYKMLESVGTVGIAIKSKHCVACYIENSCYECKFGEIAGICRDATSCLYNQWYTAYNE